MQAVAGIPETGVCDAATWSALLGAQALQGALQEAGQLVSWPSRKAFLISSEAEGCCRIHAKRHVLLWGTQVKSPGSSFVASACCGTASQDSKRKLKRSESPAALLCYCRACWADRPAQALARHQPQSLQALHNLLLPGCQAAPPRLGSQCSPPHRPLRSWMIGPSCERAKAASWWEFSSFSSCVGCASSSAGPRRQSWHPEPVVPDAKHGRQDVDAQALLIPGASPASCAEPARVLLRGGRDCLVAVWQ